MEKHFLWNTSYSIFLVYLKCILFTLYNLVLHKVCQFGTFSLKIFHKVFKRFRHFKFRGWKVFAVFSVFNQKIRGYNERWRKKTPCWKAKRLTNSRLIPFIGVAANVCRKVEIRNDSEFVSTRKLNFQTIN